jgi:hypothetical protein
MPTPNQAVAEVVCECGHKGNLLFDCQDRQWLNSVWGLDGFKYKALFICYSTGRVTRPDDLLEQLQAECPSCGRSGAIRYA